MSDSGQDTEMRLRQNGREAGAENVVALDLIAVGSWLKSNDTTAHARLQ